LLFIVKEHGEVEMTGASLTLSVRTGSRFTTTAGGFPVATHRRKVSKRCV